MCGRYTLTQPKLQAEYRTDNTLPLSARYNIAPSSAIPIVVANADTNRLLEAHWGFRVRFGEEDSLLINARSETLEEKKTFKPHLSTRCLVPATGFYEWQRQAESKAKIPHYIHLPDRDLFAFAGICRTTKEGETEVVILTINPNALMKPIHNRMPVILPKDAESRWLSGADYNEVCELLRPYPTEQMSAYPVSRAVNTPSHDSPDLLNKFRYDLEA